MADVNEMRIFAAEQIEVPPEMPAILKEFVKEVIRNNPAPQDLVRFSRQHFENKLNERKASSSGQEQQM
jgi:hypothetical protein